MISLKINLLPMVQVSGQIHNSSTYDADMTANASRATDVDAAVTQEVQQKISEIIDALFNGPSLDDDFYEAAVPDANYDITIDAIKFQSRAGRYASRCCRVWAHSNSSIRFLLATMVRTLP